MLAPGRMRTGIQIAVMISLTSCGVSGPFDGECLEGDVVLGIDPGAAEALAAVSQGLQTTLSPLTEHERQVFVLTSLPS